MGLKEAVKKLIMKDVIQSSCLPAVNSSKGFNRSVLVLDKIGSRIISSCCKMSLLSDNGIVLVEDLLKVREPVNLDAIYFLTPTQSSINALINDFPKYGATRYRAAHIYFTRVCPDILFKLLSKSLPMQKVVSFKEINIDFIPFESQVFSLDCHEIFQSYYNSLLTCDLIPHMEYLAFQIASVCYVLNEYPSVRYIKRAENTHNAELAHMVEKQLNMLKEVYPIMGQSYGQTHSQLIIFDRSYDFISPILHEFTFQAMAYEHMLMHKNIYVFKEDHADEKEVVFDENDDLWVKYRHHHVADLANILSECLKGFVNESDRIASNTECDTSTGALSQAIKELPQYKKQLNKLSTYMSVVRNCMDFYSVHMGKLCTFEQDMVMGEDEPTYSTDHNNIKDELSAFLKDDNLFIQNKIRLIMLFVLSMNGVSEDTINKLVEDAQLSQDNKQTILNSNKLCINSIGKKKEKRKIPCQDNDPSYQKYQISRWAPLVKDLMENCIENKLDPKCFPYVSDRNLSNEKHAASSSRYTASNVTWHKVKDPNEHRGSRVIVFIVGGVTYSEMRCAYEVSKKYKDWEVVIGSSHILTPDDFIKDLSDLGENSV